MIGVYSLVVSVGYYYLGESAEYLMDVLDGSNGQPDHPAPNAISNGFLIIHVLVGYAINGNVMNKAIYALFQSDKEPTDSLWWLFATSITLVVSFILANVVPDLSEILGLVGASFGYALTFVFPAVFWLRIVPKEQQSDLAFGGHVAVLVMAVGVISIGMYAEIDKLVSILKDEANAPFTC